jgi:hypothetical protein
MKLTAAEWLIKQVKAKEWQSLYIWHKEEIFKEALHKEWAQMDKIKEKKQNT